MRLRVPLLPSWVRWLAVLSLARFIFYVSIVTAPPETVDPFKPEFLALDKWRHFVAYAVLCLSLAYATATWELQGWLLATLVIGSVVIFGVGIEFGQSLIPRRYFSVGDAVANAVGGLLVTPWYLVRSRLEFVSVSEFLGR
ncbi:MAG: VanZ family protein [Halobacteriales archaeon]|nr:VanZ family protein [Halobacteriales archaeon]